MATSFAFTISLAFLIGLLATSSSFAQQRQIETAVATGTSSKTYRKKAASRIPYQQLPAANRQTVADIVKSASIYRQLPVTTIQSDPDMYLFLLRYPEAIIGTWRLMDVSEMTARRTGPFSLHATDGAGTTTNAELIFGQPGLNIYYAEGEYDGPMLFRKVSGKCVIMVETEYQRDTNDKVQVTSRMNVFLKIDNLAASIIAKTIHPLVGTTADHNFVETLKFAEKLSETSERNGPGVQRMVSRLEGLDPAVQSRFQELAGIVWQRSQSQSVAGTMQQAGYNKPIQPPASQHQSRQPSAGQHQNYRSMQQHHAHQHHSHQHHTHQQPGLQQPGLQQRQQPASRPVNRQMQMRSHTQGYSVGDSNSQHNASNRNYRGR